MSRRRGHGSRLDRQVAVGHGAQTRSGGGAVPPAWPAGPRESHPRQRDFARAQRGETQRLNTRGARMGVASMWTGSALGVRPRPAIHRRARRARRRALGRTELDCRASFLSVRRKWSNHGGGSTPARQGGGNPPARARFRPTERSLPRSIARRKIALGCPVPSERLPCERRL